MDPLFLEYSLSVYQEWTSKCPLDNMVSRYPGAIYALLGYPNMLFSYCFQSVVYYQRIGDVSEMAEKFDLLDVLIGVGSIQCERWTKSLNGGSINLLRDHDAL